MDNRPDYHGIALNNARVIESFTQSLQRQKMIIEMIEFNNLNKEEKALNLKKIIKMVYDCHKDDLDEHIQQRIEEALEDE